MRIHTQPHVHTRSYSRKKKLYASVNEDDLETLKAHDINMSMLVNDVIHNMAECIRNGYKEELSSIVSNDVANAVRYIDRKNGEGYVSYIIMSEGRVPPNISSMVTVCLRDVMGVNYSVQDVEKELKKMYL